MDNSRLAVLKRHLAQLEAGREYSMRYYENRIKDIAGEISLIESGAEPTPSDIFNDKDTKP
jgi:hypothetical protein